MAKLFHPTRGTFNIEKGKRKRGGERRNESWTPDVSSSDTSKEEMKNVKRFKGKRKTKGETEVKKKKEGRRKESKEIVNGLSEY